MKVIADALRESGASPTEIAYLAAYPGGLVRCWDECRDPVLLMRLAGALGADPKSSLGIAIEAASSVLSYVSPAEPRPKAAIEAAKNWLHARTTARDCEEAGQRAEAVAQAYRDIKTSSKVDRRIHRAAAHAAFAAAKTALVARDAALTTELVYDETYTFEDAWNGARISCAIGAAQVLLDAAEAAIAATSANVTLETETPLAGQAAADETRPLALGWAANLVRAHLDTEALSLRDSVVS